MPEYTVADVMRSAGITEVSARARLRKGTRGKKLITPPTRKHKVGSRYGAWIFVKLTGSGYLFACRYCGRERYGKPADQAAGRYGSGCGGCQAKWRVGSRYGSYTYLRRQGKSYVFACAEGHEKSGSSALKLVASSCAVCRTAGSVALVAGVRITAQEAAELAGVSVYVIRQRMSRGWAGAALIQPSMGRRS